MAVTESTAPRADVAEMGWLLQRLRDQAIVLALPCLLLGGLALLAFPWRFRDPTNGEWAGIALWLMAGAVWGLRRLSSLACAWALVVGCLAANLLVVAWGGVWGAVYLVSLPAGLAALAIGVPAGLAVSAACTLFLLRAPSALVPADGLLRIVTVIGVWGTVALVCLTRRPLLTALEWSWSSYERSRSLLERARDYQVQLKQTLLDLADANVQLTRLNRLADALRQAAEEARQAKEQFVANVSHELRTPLNMIIGFSEMITQSPQTYGVRIPPALLADLEIILRNSQHLAGLIDDVLDLSQIEARRMALTRERAGLAEIVEAAAVAVHPLFESKGLYLRTAIPGDLALFCDRTRIREVVLNLLSNAGRFTEGGGVEVRAWREERDVVVSVADTGPGIAAGDMEKLFQPFQQLDGSVRRRYGGSGLGLAISKSFVELHGGSMWLESEQGTGTTFYFRLPAEPSAPMEGSIVRWLKPDWEYEERTRRPLAPPPVVRPRVVVVDPSGSLERLAARYLQDTEVVAAGSQEEAAQKLAQVPSQALLVNDSSVARALQRLAGSGMLPPGVPGIICSIPGVPEAAAALGVSDYLVKPISSNLLLGTLDRLGLRGNTVLVVDDEPEALRLFWRMLASDGHDYRVLTAANGEEALAILRRERVDAVLLDLVMPEMDGFRLLEVRSLDPALREIPVVVTSARDPAGQPIVSSALAVIQRDGLSTPQLLACITAIRGILAPAGQPAPRGLPGNPHG